MKRQQQKQQAEERKKSAWDYDDHNDIQQQAPAAASRLSLSSCVWTDDDNDDNGIQQQAQVGAAATAKTLSNTNRSSTQASSSAAAQQRPLLCRFFVLQGRCWYGVDCAYSHTLPDNMSLEQAKKQIPCPYFATGNCRYGDYCQLRHDEHDLHNNDQDDSSIVCGICLESVMVEKDAKKPKKNKFGLLSCCNHVFCFTCLMNWRKQGEAEDCRSCPTCRKHSDYVIPSTIFPSCEAEKERIVADYKTKLGRIPCKHFDGTLGSCPFGRDCFYLHLDDETGLDCKDRDQSMQELYEQRRSSRRSRQRRSARHILDDDLEMLHSFMLLLDAYGSHGIFGYDDDDDDDWSDDDDTDDDDDEDARITNLLRREFFLRGGL